MNARYHDCVVPRGVRVTLEVADKQPGSIINYSIAVRRRVSRGIGRGRSWPFPRRWIKRAIAAESGGTEGLDGEAMNR